jgi:hypothetical protein
MEQTKLLNDLRDAFETNMPGIIGRTVRIGAMSGGNNVRPTLFSQA